MDHHHHHHSVPAVIPAMNMSNMSMTTMANMVMNHSGHMNMNTSMSDMGGMDMGHGGMDMGHGDHGDHGMQHGNVSCSGGMMMFFHTGKCEYILFESLYTQTTGHIVGAAIAVFFLAIIYEGLKYGREVLVQRTTSKNKYITTTLPNGTSQENIIVGGTQTVSARMLSCSHFVQTLLHMLQVFISYCLMLIFMTYNAWLCIAIILGAGAGYFIFGWRRAVIVDVNEHCH
ncbi:high affinity copper uptake protein 1 [Patella vulgata]|uniref:high affinity copper uptake protein 1 n=1 Tax=Patella vulgata TaxID=6465 RepID=UPI00217F5EB9|nr:high affinity copper uptake protein 1 [Patella vulgata]